MQDTIIAITVVGLFVAWAAERMFYEHLRRISRYFKVHADVQRGGDPITLDLLRASGEPISPVQTKGRWYLRLRTAKRFLFAAAILAVLTKFI